jgi:hypothetical protein
MQCSPLPPPSSTTDTLTHLHRGAPSNHCPAHPSPPVIQSLPPADGPTATLHYPATCLHRCPYLQPHPTPLLRSPANGDPSNPNPNPNPAHDDCGDEARHNWWRRKRKESYKGWATWGGAQRRTLFDQLGKEKDRPGGSHRFIIDMWLTHMRQIIIFRICHTYATTTTSRPTATLPSAAFIGQIHLSPSLHPPLLSSPFVLRLRAREYSY